MVAKSASRTTVQKPNGMMYDSKLLIKTNAVAILSNIASFRGARCCASIHGNFKTLSDHFRHVVSPYSTDIGTWANDN